MESDDTYLVSQICYNYLKKLSWYSLNWIKEFIIENQSCFSVLSENVKSPKLVTLRTGSTYPYSTSLKLSGSEG